MNINDFELYNDYSIFELMDAFNNKSFYFGKGMNYISASNCLVLISKYTKGRIYQDEIKNGKIYYTGMGQEGDQQIALQNKTLAMAKQNNTTVYMFLVYEESKYTYYGRVELDEPYYFADENDKNSTLRKVIKFPLRFIDAMAPLSPKQLQNALSAGNIPAINVVGASIVVDGKLLCCLRANNKIQGNKWEFVGGKVEKDESNEEALIRELREELDIEIKVGEILDFSRRYDKEINSFVNLTVYSAEIISGTPKNKEHNEIRWVQIQDIENLDWAPSDIPIVQTLLETQPGEILETVDYHYRTPKKNTSNKRDVKRACQDYEKSQKKKMKSGEAAEQAVIRFERKRIAELGRPDLSYRIKQISKDSPDYSYDIKSFDIIDNKVEELHIEVKSGTLTGGKIEFFISQAEFNKYKDDNKYKIYVLLKNGIVNYKLHVINKDEFLSENYMSPFTFKVSIPIKEF